jgi:hypothetical protein
VAEQGALGCSVFARHITVIGAKGTYRYYIRRSS